MEEQPQFERVDIDEKLRSSYLSYAMSVITARALPDVRDGLKPVQRRILYAMDVMGIRSDQPTRKSARIVGEVLGKYHPHGDTAVYDAMVRMAQDFSMRYPLVEGQGNFGSIDGDSQAAMRYTEARLSKLGEQMLTDLHKDTVDMIDNFDGSLQEPTVLTGMLPCLLLNGVGGIAVGMATNIPPHNLSELVDAISYIIDHYDKLDDITLDHLMKFIQGPDFPTGGSILGTEGIRQAYATGKGRIIVRARAHVEDLGSNRTAIIITELPYLVNKSTLVERIATLVREGSLEGIADLRDETDRTGIRVVIELKRNVEAVEVLQLLLKKTQMQTTFGANMLALVDGEPQVLSLKRILVHYIQHRQEVIRRRSEYELAHARERAHVLEGLLIALDNLDEVIHTIRHSQNADTALTNLCRKFKLTEIQARAILDMQLRRLAALERLKIEQEYKELQSRIKELEKLLASPKAIRGVIKDDLNQLKADYGDARRTSIVDGVSNENLSLDDLVADEDYCVSLSRDGGLLAVPLEQYEKSVQSRKRYPDMAAEAGDPLFIMQQINSRETVYFFTNKGRALTLQGHQLPINRIQTGKLVRLEDDEHVVAIDHTESTSAEIFVSLLTRNGKVKRLEMEQMQGIPSSGESIIRLSAGDALVGAFLTKGDEDLMVVTAGGKAIRFTEDSVRPQGKSGGGIKAISLVEDDIVIAATVINDKQTLILGTATGFGRRTSAQEFSTQGRGGVGLNSVDTAKSELTGPITTAIAVDDAPDLMLGTRGGKISRIAFTDIPSAARGSWGRIVTRTRSGAIFDLDPKDDALSHIVPLYGIAAAEPSSTKKTTAEPSKPKKTTATPNPQKRAPTRPK